MKHTSDWKRAARDDAFAVENAIGGLTAIAAAIGQAYSLHGGSHFSMKCLHGNCHVSVWIKCIAIALELKFKQ